jgi:hypothetical protein
MKKGDSTVIFVYPPDELADEAVSAISEFLYEMCRSFEQHYHSQITRHMNVLERDTRQRVYTGHPNKTRDEEESF